MTKMVLNSLRAFVIEEDAPTMVEYGILASLIAIVAAVGVGQFGISVGNLFDVVVDSMP